MFLWFFYNIYSSLNRHNVCGHISNTCTSKYPMLENVLFFNTKHSLVYIKVFFSQFQNPLNKMALIFVSILTVYISLKATEINEFRFEKFSYFTIHLGILLSVSKPFKQNGVNIRFNINCTHIIDGNRDKRVPV